MFESHDLIDKALPRFRNIVAKKSLREGLLVDDLLGALVGRYNTLAQSWLGSLPDWCNLKNSDPDIVFGFTEGTKVEAHAFEDDHRFFITVSVGAVAVLYDFFLRLLTMPEVFPWVGAASAETRDGCGEPLGFDAGARILSRPGGGGSKFVVNLVVPRCPERRDFAATLAAFAIDFLFLHELRHILAGHIVYRETLGVVAADEMDPPNPDVDRNMKLQATEMDADAFAARRVFLDLSRGLQPVAPSAPDLRDDWVKSQTNAIVGVYAAIDAFFRLCVHSASGRRANDWTAGERLDGGELPSSLREASHLPGRHNGLPDPTRNATVLGVLPYRHDFYESYSCHGARSGTMFQQR